MQRNQNRVGIVLNGDYLNDARVLRTVGSFQMEAWEIHLIYIGDNISKGNLGEDVIMHPVKERCSFVSRILSRTFFSRQHLNLRAYCARLDINFDVVWANDLPSIFPSLYLKLRPGAIRIYDSHEIYLETINQFFPTNSNYFKKVFHMFNIQLMKRLGRLDEKRMIKRMDLIITVNDSFRDFFSKEYGWKNIVVLRNTPTLKEIRPVALHKILGLEDTRKIVLYQGNLNSGRGLHLIIESLALLPDFYHLLILGEGYIKEELVKLASELNVSSRVTFFGMVPYVELLNYTASANVGMNLLEPVNLSKYLTSPNKLYEYAHACVPVVSSDTPESRKFLENYKIGRITENVVSEIVRNIRMIGEKDSYNEAEFFRCRQDLNWEEGFRLVISSISHLRKKNLNDS